MKIIRVTEDQFESLWNKLTPMQRTSIGLAERNIAFYSYNALVVVADEMKFLELPDLGSNVSLNALKFFAKNKTMEGYVATPAPEVGIQASKYYEFLAHEAKKLEDKSIVDSAKL